MTKNKKPEEVIIRLIAVAIGSYVALEIATPLAHFVEVLIPKSWLLDESCDIKNCFWISMTYPLLIAYSLTGGILGICLWLLFKNSARQPVKFIPLFIFLAHVVNAYSAWQLESSFRARLGVEHEENFWSYCCVDFLVSSYGLALLVALPMSAFMAVWYLQKFSSKQASQTIEGG